MQRAQIVNFNDFDKIRSGLGKIVATSGGYDPIHPGHLSCIEESLQFGNTLVVIVNGDAFLKNKKGKPFQNLETRCLILSYIRGIDFIIPFEIENDQTVSQALQILKPQVFTKGGDRISPETIPEWNICQKLGIEIQCGVGSAKKWSSSDFLKNWNRC